jgi:SAM-dependent methyltransferase
MDLGSDNRDYDVYTDLMSDDPVLQQKFEDIEEFVRPGIIVDDGCGDGALLGKISQLYPDVTLIGADLSREMIERTKKTAKEEDFDDALITAHQFDITESISRFGPVDTIISSSTGHEIWSYGEGNQEMQHYLNCKNLELANGGRMIIRDVIGPKNLGEDIGLWLNSENGQNTDIYETFQEDQEQTEHLDSLSTRARLKRFEQDFEGREYEGVKETFEHEGEEILVMEKADAAEYLLTKDYTDNWDSEMTESFTHWNQTDYENALEDAGFDVIHSETYTNEWIQENRFEPEAQLYELDEELSETGYPPTNIVIVGEK